MKKFSSLRPISICSKASRDTLDKRAVVNPNTAEPSRTDEIWSIYNREAEVYDRRLVEGWKDDMDGALIFTGLFSAIVTAFIIETYKNLMPDSSETTTTILMQISQQLASGTNQTTMPAISHDRIAFKPPSSAVRCNVLLFLSLVFSLFGALAAILVRQWARNYLHGTQRRRTAPVRGLIRTYLHEGIISFQLNFVVNAIPTLLHIALLLFGVGIYEFFAPIHPMLRSVALFSLVLGAVFYVGTALVASFFSNSPYQTPLSSIFWYLMWPLRRLLSGRRTSCKSRIFELEHHSGVNNDRPQATGHVTKGQDFSSIHSTALPQAIDHVTKALRWTLQTLDTREKMEPFIAGIPEFFNSHEVDAPKVMLNLLAERDDNVMPLMSHVRQFLSAVRNRDQSHRLSIAIPAIWSLIYETCGIKESALEAHMPWEHTFKELSRYVNIGDAALASQVQHTLLILLCRSWVDGHGAWHPTRDQIISTLETVRISLGPNGPALKLSSCTPDDLHMAAFTMLLSVLHGSSFHLPIASHPWPSRQNIIPSLFESLEMSRVCPGLQRYFVKTVVDAFIAPLKGGEESKLEVDRDGHLLGLLTKVTDGDTLTAAEKLLKGALSSFDSHHGHRSTSIDMRKCRSILDTISRLAAWHAARNHRHRSLAHEIESESQWQLVEHSTGSKIEETMKRVETPLSVRRSTVTFSTSPDILERHHESLAESSEESRLLENESASGWWLPEASKPVIHRLSSTLRQT